MTFKESILRWQDWFLPMPASPLREAAPLPDNAQKFAIGLDHFYLFLRMTELATAYALAGKPWTSRSDLEIGVAEIT